MEVKVEVGDIVAVEVSFALGVNVLVGVISGLISGWQADRKIDPRSEKCIFSQLYAKDGVGPSPAGSYLTALTMAVAMTVMNLGQFLVFLFKRPLL